MKNFNERDKEMKKSLIALLSATALGTVWANELMKLPANPEGPLTLNRQERANGSGTAYGILYRKHYIAGGFHNQKVDCSAGIQASIQDGALVLDISKAKFSDKGVLECSFGDPDPAHHAAEAKTTFEVCIQGPAGAKLDLMPQGYTVNGKHSYNRETFNLTGEKQILTITRTNPDEMKTLSLRIDLKAPGVYKFYQVDANLGE